MSLNRSLRQIILLEGTLGGFLSLTVPAAAETAAPQLMPKPAPYSLPLL